jgi:hypothetical protein
MNTGLKFVERRVAANPQPLADRIERFGRAMTATQLAALLPFRESSFISSPKKGESHLFGSAPVSGFVRNLSRLGFEPSEQDQMNCCLDLQGYIASCLFANESGS